MTIDEAIKHAEEIAEEQEKLCRFNDDFNFSQPKWRKCAEEHRQLAEWLKELRVFKLSKEESRIMLSNLDRSMECVLESDQRSFSNRETENGWLFDHIIEWRKMIKPFIKEE